MKIAFKVDAQTLAHIHKEVHFSIFFVHSAGILQQQTGLNKQGTVLLRN